MPYTVEIITPAIEDGSHEQASRLYQLADVFTTVAEAKEVAGLHIAELEFDPVSVLFNVFDREGFTVASNVDQPVEAG